jgi:hypothetical protein
MSRRCRQVDGPRLGRRGLVLWTGASQLPLHTSMRGQKQESWIVSVALDTLSGHRLVRAQASPRTSIDLAERVQIRTAKVKPEQPRTAIYHSRLTRVCVAT